MHRLSLHSPCFLLPLLHYISPLSSLSAPPLSLHYLYLGGNCLQQVPSELAHLDQLKALVLCDNQIQSIPQQLTRLTQLRSLQLHNNQLETLPQDLVKLTNLRELSLRGNPLVLRFVREMPNTVPSLLELSGRCIMKQHIHYDRQSLPCVLVDYLNSACCCDNPRCNGVYFTSKVERVKFVDFCGKYRVPLMQYLCTERCASDDSGGYSSSSDEEPVDEEARLRRVLLG